MAADWEITPRIAASELFTDNVALTKENPQSDFITIVSPGISIARKGAARTRLAVDFGIERTYYLEDSTRNETHESLDADLGVEVFEDVFFIDGLAEITQATTSPEGAESGTGITDQSNRTQIFAGTLNPNLRHHFGNWADARIDLTLANVRADSEDFEDTMSDALTAQVTSGREFAFLKWTVDLSSERTEFSESSREDERRLAQLELQYVDRILFQPIATIGYEEIEDGTLVDPPQGFIWSLGGLLEPGPRTSIRLTHGRRYNNPNTALEASYAVSSRTRLTASIEQVLETSQSLATGDLDADDEALISRGEGFALTNNTFRQDNFFIALDAERGRNAYRVEAAWSKRETDVENASSTVQSMSASWQRALSRSLGGALDASFRNTETTEIGGTSKDRFLTFGIDLNYALARDWDAAFNYTGTIRTSDDETVEYTENAFTFTLTATF
jgi:uncharacterized protein (PEP-CTERM system associated)